MYTPKNKYLNKMNLVLKEIFTFLVQPWTNFRNTGNPEPK